MMMSADQSALLVIDVQEKLAPATAEPARVINLCERLMTSANRMNIPILASQHYPKGLGPLVPELAALAPEGAIIDKIHFSGVDEPRFFTRFRELGRRQAVICGMEAHVCVMQTAIGLLETGYDVFVVADAVTSRDLANRALALDRLRDLGASIVAFEMVLFEWLARGDTPAFKDLIGLIK